MGIVEDKIRDLKAREAKVLEMGGEKAVASQRDKGKLTARERLDLLFDKGTFREIDMFVNHRCVNFEMDKIKSRLTVSSPATAWWMGGRYLPSPRILLPEPAVSARCMPKRSAK